MNRREIENMFIEAGILDKTDNQRALKMYYNILEELEEVETDEKYREDKELLKIYALTTGYIFLLTMLKQYDVAEKSLCAAEDYLSHNPFDFDVNEMYLLLSNCIFKYENSYKKTLELLQCEDKVIKRLALKYLSLPDYYLEGLLSKNEYQKYESEYCALKSKE